MQCTCTNQSRSPGVLVNLQLRGHDHGGEEPANQQHVEHQLVATQYLLQLLDLICSLAILPFKAMHIIPMYATSIHSCQQLSSLLLKLVCGMQAPQQHRM